MILCCEEQCPKCAAQGRDNSCDNLAVYNDGHAYCYACAYYKKGDATNMEVKVKSNLKLMRVLLFPSRRGITEDTARRYGYEVANINNKRVEIANFYQDGRLVAQHLRGPNKQFHWNGNSPGVTLWGQHLWKPGGKNFTLPRVSMIV